MSIRESKKVNKTKLREHKKGPKTFKSEELAKSWAKEHNVAKYKLVNIRHLGAKDKKIKIVLE